MPANQVPHTENPEIPAYINRALQQMRLIPGFGHVRFIIFYGSAEKKRMNAASDIDLCIYYDGNRTDAAQFRHTILTRLPGSHYDIQIFQQLPLYVRVEVLKGIPVFTRDLRFLYETANQTIRDFEDYKHRLYDYTGQAAIS